MITIIEESIDFIHYRKLTGPETTYDYEDNSGKIWKCPKKGWRMKKKN